MDNIGGLYSSSSDPGEFPSKAYDNMQNYGLVSLSDSLYIKGKSNVVAMLADRIPIKEGQEEVYDVTIDFSSSWCTTQTLSVTCHHSMDGQTRIPILHRYMPHERYRLIHYQKE